MTIKITNGWRIFFCLFILLGILDLTAAPPALAWRSDMYPVNWEPVDKIQVKSNTAGVDPTRVNIFYDVKGTKDQNGATVSSTDPRYHPYRFLHDFSYAGYQAGNKPVPPLDPTWTPKNNLVVNILTSTYTGKSSCTTDGKTNCTPTIQAAINYVASQGGGVVYIPAGEFRLSRANSTYFLKIQSNNVVLRGAGSDKTFLKVNPYTVENFDINSTANFSMNENTVFLIYSGPGTDYGWDKLGNQKTITQDLLFPTKVIPVSDVTGFDVNDANKKEIMIYANYDDGDDNSFVTEHDMKDIWGGANSDTPEAYIFRRTIKSIDPVNKTITVDVPTRYRIKKTDNPKVELVATGISEVGVEKLAIGVIRHPKAWDFDTQKVLKENWRNYLMKWVNVNNGWLYDVKTYTPVENKGRSVTANNLTYDIDYLNHGVYLKHCRFVTIKNLHLKNSQMNGHGNGNGYSFTMFSSNELLLDNSIFELVKKGFAFNRQSSGNVIKDLTARNILFYPHDFHSNLSMANLIDNINTDIVVEAAVRPIGAVRSGNADDATYHGHGTTQTVFWNSKGLKKPTAAIENWDKETPEVDDAIIASNQYGWGYIIGSYGPFSKVVTARMPNRRDTTSSWRPYIMPEDYEECVSYDTTPVQGAKDCSGSIEPRSLYEDQLSRRLGINTTPPPPPPGPATVEVNTIVIDNMDPAPNYVKTGTGWTTSVTTAPPPYGVNAEYSKVVGDKAAWNFTLTTPGKHEIYAWWTPHSNRATAVPYTVYDGNNLLATYPVNQTTGGGQWTLLGTHDFTTTSGKVELTATVAGLSHLADAVKFVLKPEDYIVDNQDLTGYSETGSGWTNSLAEDPHNGESRYSKTYGDKASWKKTLPGGMYDIYVWWTAHENRATSADYKIYNGTTLVGTKLFNQTINGGQWNLLGRYYINNGEGRVDLTVTTAGLSHSADAVKFTKIPTAADTTPPSTPTVADGGTFTSSSNSLFCSWSSTDAESGIKEYYYKITANSITGLDVKDMTLAGKNTSVTVTGLNLTSGTKYFFTVKACNDAGICSTFGYSDGITVDTTAPATPVVSDGGVFTISNSYLSSSWSSADTESGIKEYYYKITSGSAGGPIVKDETSAGINTSVTATGLSLANGTKYFFMVKACNNAGVCSGFGYADGITVDTTPPDVPIVSDSGVSSGSSSQLSASWEGNDTQSGIMEYQYKITMDSTTGTTVRDWTTVYGNNNITASGFSLIEGRKYFFSVKARNGAGLWSYPGYSDGITIVYPVDIIIDNKSISFSKTGTWTVSQAASPYPLVNGDSLYSNIVNSSASWSTSLPSGTYQVYAWWTSTDNRATAANYVIYNGSSQVGVKTVNQTTSGGGGGKWNLLGTYTITTGTGKVTLTVTDGTKFYSADAIRFTK